ncbi:MAG: hypothetical protein JO345_24435 [Streptosporangiaceae bacterium]|nr:hypothetical protein [Streptosporangiaceae bacterium]
MSAATISPELVQLEELHERAEQLCEEAAEAERAAFVAWQEAYGAYEVARDEAAASWAAWVEALIS